MACRLVRFILVPVLVGLFFSCRHKKISLADDESVDIRDFIAYFRPLSLPVQFSDTVFTRHAGDTASIGYRVITRFVPDSVFAKSFGKAARPKCYALGKAGGGKNETYIFVRAQTAQKKLLYVFCFDRENRFAAAKVLMVFDGEDRNATVVSMDSRFTLTLLRQRTEEGQVFYRKEAYVFNDAGLFTLILTESNEAKPANQPVYNPIDTVAHRHKFSGDYVEDKRNFISVRDARDNSRFLFFVHFEKEGGKCRGELKGEAKFTGAGRAHYKSNGDPCQLEFVFSGDRVRMSELEGCGNHRDIRCLFEGSFERKKESRPKPTTKKVR